MSIAKDLGLDFDSQPTQESEPASAQESQAASTPEAPPDSLPQETQDDFNSLMKGRLSIEEPEDESANFIFPTNQPEAEEHKTKPAEQPVQKAKPQPEPKPEPAKPSQVEAALLNQVQQLQQQIQQMQKAAEKVPEKKEPTEDEIISELSKLYNFNVGSVPELVEGLRSDDPAKFINSMNIILNSVGMNTHRILEAKMQEMVDQRLTAAQQQIPQDMMRQLQQAAYAERVKNDFYSNYSDLARPELIPLVQTVADQVGKEFNAQTWTPQIRDEVAKRVYQIIGGPQPVQQRAAPQQKPAQQFMSSGSPTRQPAKAFDPNDASIIREIVSFNG